MIKGIIQEFKIKKIIPFCFIWCVFFAALFYYFYDAEVNKINATMLAFSYKYGFISRGLIGSIFQGINSIVPFDMMNYYWVSKFNQVITAGYFLIIFCFFIYAVYKCKLSVSDEIKYIIIFFTIWAIPMFITEYNYGRLDVYCVMLSLLGAMVLIWGKAEWLVVIFSALGVMVHQGNVFMFLNIILVLLLYKALTNQKSIVNKYSVLFLLSFVVASILFLYFEFFSHMNGTNIYEELVSIASGLRYDGTYHEDVIDHEILGVDLSEREIPFRLMNLLQFPVFLVLMFPFIIFAVKLFKNIYHAAQTNVDKIKYIIVFIGAGTIIPDLLLKCDYGRWMFAIICYYCVVFISLLAMKDEIVTNEIKMFIKNVNDKFPTANLLLAYVFMLQPLMDVSIIYLTAVIADRVNNMFFHFQW